MPHVNSASGGEDLASTDEVKVYDDEGEEEQRSSENLSEDKLGLVTETEEVKKSLAKLQSDAEAFDPAYLLRSGCVAFGIFCVYNME
jgi:transcription factor 7-like 2